MRNVFFERETDLNFLNERINTIYQLMNTKTDKNYDDVKNNIAYIKKEIQVMKEDNSFYQWYIMVHPFKRFWWKLRNYSLAYIKENKYNIKK